MGTMAGTQNATSGISRLPTPSTFPAQTPPASCPWDELAQRWRGSFRPGLVLEATSCPLGPSPQGQCPHSPALAPQPRGGGCPAAGTTWCRAHMGQPAPSAPPWGLAGLRAGPWGDALGRQGSHAPASPASAAQQCGSPGIHAQRPPACTRSVCSHSQHRWWRCPHTPCWAPTEAPGRQPVREGALTPGLWWPWSPSLPGGKSAPL